MKNLVKLSEERSLLTQTLAIAGATVFPSLHVYRVSCLMDTDTRNRLLR